MNVYIGQNIRKLRNKENLTQEQFAEVFGVSPQAVSRWENDTAYPDITLLPAIANFFEVSIDEIIGMDEIKKTNNLNKIFTEFNNHILNDEIEESISLLRDSLKLYPNNSGLLSNLSLALTLKINKNFDEKLLDEAISLSERVLKTSTSLKLNGTTTANLYFLYQKAREIDKANRLVLTLPHVWESREMINIEKLEGDEYKKELKKVIILLISLIDEKIKNVEKRVYSNPNKIFSTGFDEIKAINLEEKLEILYSFLLS